MSDQPDIQDMIDELDERGQLCVRLLTTVAGGLMEEFGRDRVFRALDILAHPDAQAVIGTMLQRTEDHIQETADQVVRAYKRTRTRKPEDS